MSDRQCQGSAYVLAALLVAGHAAAWSQAAPVQELDDPMRPPASQVVPVAAGTPEEPVALPRLQAIMRDGQQRSAVINGRVVRVGDEVDGAMVDAISASSVVVSVGGNSSVLKLVGQDIKHDARATH